MSKRMREPFHTLMWKASIGHNDSWSQVDPEVLEKFAELIVRECAKVLEIQGSNTGHEQYHYGASLIEEHFGV